MMGIVLILGIFTPCLIARFSTVIIIQSNITRKLLLCQLIVHLG